MTQPLFKVGEEVILQSKSSPHKNGEYVIEEVIPKGTIWTCKLTGLRLVASVISYKLFGCSPEKYIDGKLIDAVWGQPVLRKKYPPCDDEFFEDFKKMLTKNDGSSKMNA